jgi:hypothetical protein
MGNSQTVIEATVVNVFRDGSHTCYVVNCSPCGNLYLKENNPNFIKIYNKLITWSSHKFICKDELIIDIEPCESHYTCGIILGILDTTIEFKNLVGYHEILIEGHNKKHRLLIETKKINDLIVNDTYSIFYEKSFGSDLYKVVKYESCGY